MDHDDTAWCPVCDKAIAPKRWVEPINPPPPPPPSPTANNTVRRAKVVGKKGGLVHGTGRVRPNGSLKRTPSPPQPQTTPAQTTVAVNNEAKYRLHIDLGPTPLYCSDECQLADINRGRLPIDFNPDRQQTSSSPVTYPDHDSQCSSIESQSSMDSTTSQESSSSQSHVSPSLAKLAAHYNFGPLPPPAPIDDSESDSEPSFNNDFTGGVIMAARRMRSELLPPPRKRNEYGKLVSEPRKPIPGWTDGSNAWREATYNMSTKTPASAFTARSSNGIPSTLSRSWTKPTLTRPVTSSPVVATSQSDAELLSRFSNSYTRSPSSVSLSTSPSPSSMPPLSPPKKERSLVKKGAEGKLLVPDVKMRLPASASSTSLASMSSAPSRRTVRSPLSQSSSSEAEACDLRSSFFDRRPKIETRSWSYDNVKTYPIMELPPKKVIEKRKQKKVVDGVEVEVEIEVEVEVQEKRKRLFLFAPVTTIRA